MTLIHPATWRHSVEPVRENRVAKSLGDQRHWKSITVVLNTKGCITKTIYL